EVAKPNPVETLSIANIRHSHLTPHTGLHASEFEGPGSPQEPRTPWPLTVAIATSRAQTRAHSHSSRLPVTLSILGTMRPSASCTGQPPIGIKSTRSRHQTPRLVTETVAPPFF